MIELKNIQKNYGNTHVLKGINLNFSKGNCYGIVGENGAGKTTLFKCLAGLESFEGSIVSALSPLKNHVGYLPTDPFFFSHMTGLEYLQLLCNARNIDMVKPEEKNIFELPLQQYAITYSTGMKKKLALMALLLQGNEVLILDEPFNGVDIQSNILITEILHRLKAMGKTILISSHIFSTLSENCDEIYLMKEGSIVEKSGRERFAELEKAMKAITIGNKIERLDLK